MRYSAEAESYSFLLSRGMDSRYSFASSGGTALMGSGKAPADHDFVAFGDFFLNVDFSIRKGGAKTMQDFSKRFTPSDDVGEYRILNGKRRSRKFIDNIQITAAPYLDEPSRNGFVFFC